MAKAKKFLITTATREVTFYRSEGQAEASANCLLCAADTRFVGLDAAADAAGVGALAVIEAIRCGQVYALESTNGHLRICLRCVSGLSSRSIEQE